MIDYHCHLDLYKNPIAMFEEAKKRKMEILVVTTSPRAYLKTSTYFSGSEKIKVALGFHPELVAERILEKELFMKNINFSNYIGEIGIDGTGKNRSTISVQMDFFQEALCEIEKSSRKILSIHSRGAVKETLKIIDDQVKSSVPILHWFTGNVEEAKWAMSIGCWFSINPKMCYSKSGRELIKILPLSKILPETDGPFAQKKYIPYVPGDTTVIDYIAKSRGIEKSEIESLMYANLKTLEIETGRGQF